MHCSHIVNYPNTQSVMSSSYQIFKLLCRGNYKWVLNEMKNIEAVFAATALLNPESRERKMLLAYFAMILEHAKPNNSEYETIKGVQNSVKSMIIAGPTMEETIWISETKKYKYCGNPSCQYFKGANSKAIVSNVKMRICKGCKLIYFCSRKCQKICWNRFNHKFH